MGKSTLVKQVLQETSIPYLFFTADNVPPENTAWIGESWAAARARMEMLQVPEFLLVIDEVHKIDQWSEAVKKEWDADSFNDIPLKVVLLGSSRLLSFEEASGASAVINEWLSQGHNVSIITGRPFSSYEPSRAWLDSHGLQDVKVYFLDKYGRENFLKNCNFSLKLEDYYKMQFDYAIEDSPLAFKFFNHLPDLKVMVFDRPWNRDASFPNVTTQLSMHSL